jgi:hypothetical protein
MEPTYCSYSVLPANKQRKSSRKSCKKTNKKSKSSSRCELICNRCGLKQNREQRLTRRKSLRDNLQNPLSESYSAPSQKKSRKTLERKPVASVITNDSSSKLTYSEISQLNEKGVTNSIIDIYPVEYWREFLRPKSIDELQKRERRRKEKKIEVASYVDSSTPLLSDVANDERQPFVEELAFAPRKEETPKAVKPYVFGQAVNYEKNKFALDELTEEEQQLLEKNGWTLEELERYYERAKLYEKNELLRRFLINEKALTFQEKKVLVKNGWDINTYPLLDSPNSVREQFILPDIKAEEWFAERKRISEEQTRMARGPY